MVAAGPGRDGTVGRGEGPKAAEHVFRELTAAQLEALGTWHSGLAEVSVQEWAILLRCNGDKSVETDELVASLLEWFAQPLSAGEISGFLDRLVEREFLLGCDDGRSFQTTPLGAEVLRQTKGPLIRGAMWMLQHKDGEGDGDGNR